MEEEGVGEAFFAAANTNGRVTPEDKAWPSNRALTTRGGTRSMMECGLLPAIRRRCADLVHVSPTPLGIACEDGHAGSHIRYQELMKAAVIGLYLTYSETFQFYQ